MIEHKLMKTRQWVLDTEAKAVEYAKSKGMYVSANAEDSTRTDMDFLLKFARMVRDAGADRLRFCDTVGYVDPVATYDMVKTIVDEVGIDIEMHCHNDMGMAVANSLAGVRAGAGWIGATMNGLGERAGNAALEEVVMALKITMGVDVGVDTTMFKEVCDYVALASHCELPIWKPIIGERVFSHASGIHANGVIKDPRNYETFLPEDVGMSGRRINIGKHSGMAAVRNRYSSLGIELTEQEARELLEILRVETVELKRTPTAGELKDIYEEYKRNEKGIS